MRNFTEKKELPTVVSIVSTQINALEKTIQKFDKTIATFTATYTNALKETVCK
jgi:hypothetical protein